MTSLIRKSSLMTLMNSQHPYSKTCQEKLTDHFVHVVEDVVSHASELAHHCGRQRVQRHDVAQAMSTLCVMCDKYAVDSGNNPICNVLSTSKTIGGGKEYTGFCDDAISQCGTPMGTCASFATGGKKRKSRLSKRVRRHRCISKTCTSPHHSHGGVIPSYTGYCDSLPSQCTFSDELAANAAACSAQGGRRKRRTNTSKRYSRMFSRTRRNKCTLRGCPFHQKGGNIIPTYQGYCDGLSSQCTFSDELAATASACSGQGGGRRKRYAGGTNTNPISLLIKSATRAYGKKYYDVSWPADSLRLLERGLEFHVSQVLHNTQTDEYFQDEPDMALQRTLQTIRV